MKFSYKMIDHVQLAAPENKEDQARSFYKEILGFHEIEKPEQLKKRGGVWFQFGNVVIHIGIEKPFYPAKKAHPAIRVHNISVLKTYLQSQGIEYTVDRNIPDVERFYLKDPFGNRIEFLEPKQM